jgi:hypothetical protein
MAFRVARLLGEPWTFFCDDTSEKGGLSAMNRLVILSLAALLVGCSDGSAALRPGSARLGAEIAPTTPEIAPTTDDDQLAILDLATAVSEIAPTTEQKLHQQHIRGEDQSPATYGGQNADPTWIAVALLGVIFVLIWATWIGRAVSRRMEK